MTRYQPEFVPQMDGSTCERRNCWAAVGAFLADGASGGDKDMSPTKFRALARKSGSPCQTGGLADMVRGLMNAGLWSKGKYIADMPKADLRRMLLRRNGALVALETDFQDWPEATVCQPGYNDLDDAYHSIGVICGEGKYKQKGKVLVENPLCKGYRWVDVDVVIEAVMTYNREHNERRGTADLIIVLPPMVPPQPRK